MDYFIYKITINEKPDFIYVGHTKNFTHRKYCHKNGCSETPHRKLYSQINENGGWDNCEMLLIEHIVGTKIDARIRENFFYETHREDMKDKMKEDREKNHEKSLEKKKEYYYANQEEQKLKSKEFRETHQEYIKEYKNKWYDENKERLSEKNKEKFKSECGMEYTKSNKSRHYKSQFHQNFICMKAQA